MKSCPFEGLALDPAAKVEDVETKFMDHFERGTRKKPVLQRFFGYKASGGVDADESRYSPHLLFFPNHASQHIGYSSMASENILVTGVATPYKSLYPESNGDFDSDLNKYYNSLMYAIIDVRFGNRYGKEIKQSRALKQ